MSSGKFFIKLVLLIAGVHLAPGAHADEQANLLKNWVIERAEYSAALDTHTAVSVTNHYGDIRVRTSSDNVISIFSVTQHHVNDDANPKIQIDSVENTLEITVHYPSQETDAAAIDGIAIEKRRVDVSLLIPKHVDLSLDTIKGRAESKGHKGPIQATTESGQVIIVTSGPVDVSSNDGPVTVTFKNDTWPTASRIESRTGGIQVLFIENPDVRVEMETSGTITTDYSVEIRNNVPASAKKQATASIGKATHEVTIKSLLGPVTLSRIFSMVKSG